MEFLSFILCLLALVLSLNTTSESLVLSVFILLSIDFRYLGPSHLFSQLNSTSLLSLSLCVTCQSLSSHSRWAGLAPVYLCLSCTGKPRAGLSMLSRWMTCLGMLAVEFLLQPRSLWTIFATKAHGWLAFSLVSTRTSLSFSAKLLCSQLASQMRLYLALLPTRVQDFLPISLCWTSCWLISPVSRGCCGVASATPPSFISPANVQWVQSNPSSRSIMKTFRSVGCVPNPGVLYQWIGSKLYLMSLNDNLLSLTVFSLPHCLFS